MKTRALGLLKRLWHASIVPTGPAQQVYQAFFHAQSLAAEAASWAKRTFISTPAFLAICESHGERISFERIPYLNGSCRIRLGSDIRGSGQISIHAARGRSPLLQIGNGVFLGHGTSFQVAERIQIGNCVAIGSGTYITDTEGHNKDNNELKPSWETPAGAADIAAVVIEDGVWIGKRCAILKGVHIGARSIIGLGAVVRTDVPPGSLVMGNPARVIGRDMLRAVAGQQKR